MRILKYIFLLLLLSLVALSIFIATQKGDFTVERSKVINAPKNTVYSYVNDYKNWADFGSWVTEDPDMKMQYPENTIGNGASCSWEGTEGNGTMKTIYTKENDSISQTMDYNGTNSTVSWKFKDTIGGTKVTWKTEGKMSFLFKIYTALNGGVDKVIGTMYEKSLVNLDKALDFEINTFAVKEDGLVTKPEIFYLAQTFTSEIAKVNKNFKIVTPKITTFCEENNIEISGKPFIIYHTYDLAKQLTRISICIPIKSEIFITQGSEILSGKLPAFEAVKTTVTGDISHVKKGYDKAAELLITNKLTPNPAISHIEFFITNKSEINDPSKWVTEVYIPFLPKVVPVKTYYKAPVTTTNNGDTDDENGGTEPKKIKKPVIKVTDPKVPVLKNKDDEDSEF